MPNVFSISYRDIVESANPANKLKFENEKLFDSLDRLLSMITRVKIKSVDTAMFGTFEILFSANIDCICSMNKNY